MSLRFGASTVTALRYGTTTVSKVYRGATEAWASTSTYRFFEGVDGPSGAENEGTALSIGLEFYVTTAASATALWFWRPETGVGGAVTGRIYQVASASAGTPVDGTDVTFTLSGTGWQQAPLAASVPLTPGQRYRAVIHHPSGLFPVTPQYWQGAGPGAAGRTSGPLVAPNAASATGGDQCAYDDSASITFPTSSFGAGNYWVDVSVAA